MGNNSSTKPEKEAELNDVHRKCVRTFSGTALEDPDKFLQQLEAVKVVYSLSDQSLMKLALEKIEGRALEWLHSKPGLMTYGVDNFKRALLKEFSVSNKIIEHKNVPQQLVAPSAPPKIDVLHEEMKRQVDSETFFHHMPAPPSYDSILGTSGLSVAPPQVPLYPNISDMGSFQVTNSVIPTSVVQKVEKNEKKIEESTSDPVNIEKNLEKIEKSEKKFLESDPKLKEKRNRNRNRAKKSSQPNINVEQKTEDVTKTSEDASKSSGTKPKIDLLCDFCQKAGHKSDACLLKAAKDEKTKRCFYCTAEGHLIQHCRKVPRCKKCNDNRHKTENCPETSEIDSASSILPSLMDLKLVPSADTEKNSDKKCLYCKGDDHLIKDCPQTPRCHNCGEKTHKAKDCPFNGAIKEFLLESENQPKKCTYCKEEGHLNKNCPVAPRCRNCGERYHKITECPLLKNDKNDSKVEEKDKKCAYCKATDHYYRDCEKIPRCHNCGEKFHRLKDCPKLKEDPKKVEADSENSVLGMLMNQAYNYFMATEQQEPDKVCNYCKEGGHLIKDCKVRPPCRKCGERGHKTQNCPQNPIQSLPFANPRDGFCHNCKQMGHHTVDCEFKKHSRVFTNNNKK